MKTTIFTLLLMLSCNSMADWVEYFTRPNGDTFAFDNARVERGDEQLDCVE